MTTPWPYGMTTDEPHPFDLYKGEKKFRHKTRVTKAVAKNLKKVPEGWTLEWLVNRDLTFNIDWTRKIIRCPYPKDSRGLAAMGVAIHTVRKTNPTATNYISVPLAYQQTPWSCSPYTVHRNPPSWWRREDWEQHRFKLRSWYMPGRLAYGAHLPGKSKTWPKLHALSIHHILRYMQRPEAWTLNPDLVTPGRKWMMGPMWAAAVYRARLLAFAGKTEADYPLSEAARRIIVKQNRLLTKPTTPKGGA